MKLVLVTLAVLAISGTVEVDAIPLQAKQAYLQDYESLNNDIDDFLKLMPVRDIKELFYKYLSDDEDFGEVIDYIVSDEFKSLIHEIGSQPEVMELVTYIQSSGLDFHYLIEKLKEVFGHSQISVKLNPKSYGITGGLPGFFKDLVAILPVAELEKLYHKKLETSGDFAKFIKKLKSQKFIALIDQTVANPKVGDLLHKAETKGIDVEAVIDYIKSLLESKVLVRATTKSLKNLKDDLNDFLELVPVEEIKDLFEQYLAEDEDFEEAIDYLRSDEFKALTYYVGSLVEVKQLIGYLESSGLDVHGFLEKIGKILGFDDLVVSISYKQRKITGGLPGFIQDIKSLLPIKAIEKLYYEKLSSSKDFAQLIARLRSKEFQGLLQKIEQSPEYQDLVQRAEAKGIDVQAIYDFIASILGYHRSQFSTLDIVSENEEEEVIDILHYIWAQVPMDNLTDVIFNYLLYDDDFGALAQYMLGDEFKTILKDVESLPAMKALFKYLDEVGVEIYHYLQQLHDLIGLQDAPIPPIVLSAKITGGLPGFIQDVRALLPIDYLYEYYDQKQKENCKFAKFVKRLGTVEGQNAVDALAEHRGFNLWLDKLEAKGVDLDQVKEIVGAITGIHFPDRPHHR